MAFPSRAEYEVLIYSLQDAHPEVIRSTLRLYSVSALSSIVEGEVWLNNGLRLRILEVVDFKEGRLRQYSYTVYRDEEKVRWYDPQPHRTILTWQPRFPITFTSHPTSSTTGSPLPAYPSPRLTCRRSSRIALPCNVFARLLTGATLFVAEPTRPPPSPPAARRCADRRPRLEVNTCPA